MMEVSDPDTENYKKKSHRIRKTAYGTSKGESILTRILKNLKTHLKE
jgi:cellobiose-specific phosphotransferase system component IIB